jgi:hypothetical protein
MHARIVTASLAAALFGLGCGGTTTGDGGTTSTPAELSKEGESCTRTADCDADLICIDQTCVTTAPTPAATRLSGRGETCQVTADCETSLVCWGIFDSQAPYTGSSGRCDYEHFGLTPTGKTCTAECAAATDCLELPIPDQTTITDAGIPNKTCRDLSKAISNAGVNCNGTSPMQRECFLYGAYCSSTTNPWACTSGRCIYSGGCEAGKSGEVVGGCPLYTRSGATLSVTACNAATQTCTAGAVSGCKSDSDCPGVVVHDDSPDTCSPGECVCHVASGGCYRRCRNDLECAFGYVCSSSQYCVAANSCDTDAACAVSLKRATAKCVAHTCKVPCTIDLECNGSGLLDTTVALFNGEVCHQGYCTEVGCSSNAECKATSNGKELHMFCQTPPDPSTTATPVSAITD